MTPAASISRTNRAPPPRAWARSCAVVHAQQRIVPLADLRVVRLIVLREVVGAEARDDLGPAFTALVQVGHPELVWSPRSVKLRHPLLDADARFLRVQKRATRHAHHSAHRL